MCSDKSLVGFLLWQHEVSFMVGSGNVDCPMPVLHVACAVQGVIGLQGVPQ